MDSKLLTLYSDVSAVPVKWLWEPYIAIGKITLLQGDPGCGKSTMMMNLIAELSKGGSTPDGRSFGIPQKIIYQCSEDGAKDTIKPRLVAAGADCRNIAFIDEEVNSGLTLDDERIRAAITEKSEMTNRTSIEWALKGKVRCGICNRSMGKASEKKSRIACMRVGCTNAIKEEDLNVAAMQPILRKRKRTLEQLKTIENIDTNGEEKRISELRKEQADDYEGYINGDIEGDEFRRRKEWIRAEIDNLENTISEKKEKIQHFEEQRKRMQWFLDHSKGEITHQMADEIIDSVIVAKDGVTVMFREGL